MHIPTQHRQTVLACQRRDPDVIFRDGRPCLPEFLPHIRVTAGRGTVRAQHGHRSLHRIQPLFTRLAVTRGLDAKTVLTQHDHRHIKRPVRRKRFQQGS